MKLRYQRPMAGIVSAALVITLFVLGPARGEFEDLPTGEHIN